MEILGIFFYKVVFNNDWFIVFINDDKENYRKDRSINRYIDDVNVNIRVNNYILDDGIFIDLYFIKLLLKKILDKMVVKVLVEIESKFGFLLKSVVEELWNLVDDYKL